MNPTFAKKLNRLDLLSLKFKCPGRKISIAVHRNHSFELVASVLNIFLAQGGLEAEIHYSSYDDSLTFADNIRNADIHLIWLDATRYHNIDFIAWLNERINALRSQAAGTILVACLGADNKLLPSALPGSIVCDLDSILSCLGNEAYEERLLALSGTRLSDQGCLESARALGLRYILPLFLPPIKALALDCDNTLYRGVVGEDGVDGVEPYCDVQRRLLSLKRQGFLLTLVSKNQEEDVRNLFERRDDFPLKWSDFTATAINWQPKAVNISDLAARLNIGIDAMLFVDDNPGELLQMAQEMPCVRSIEAESEHATVQGLIHYPCLHKTAIMPEDLLRSQDIKANAARDQLRVKLSPAEYRRELGIRLEFSIDPESRLDRITELLNKTNQFIFTFLRPTREEVQAWLCAPDACIVTAAMSDKLSDSGLIAILIARLDQNGSAHILELTVSCRALGRGIESEMLSMMFRLAGDALGCEKLVIHWKSGPRNKPALDWLRGFSREDCADNGSLQLTIPDNPKPDLEGVELIIHSGGLQCRD